MKLLFLISALLFLTFYQVNALTCYECKPNFQGPCEVPNENTVTIECNGYCIYYKHDKNEFFTMARACSDQYAPKYFPSEFPGHKCERNIKAQITGTACYCNTDRCVAEKAWTTKNTEEIPPPKPSTAGKTPDKTSTEGKAPDETKSGETKSGEKASEGKTKSGETKSEGGTPDETKPDETKPDETKSKEITDASTTITEEQTASTESTNGSQELICSSLILFFGLIASYFVGF